MSARIDRESLAGVFAQLNEELRPFVAPLERGHWMRRDAHFRLQRVAEHKSRDIGPRHENLEEAEDSQ